ncbi:hypothetical protein LINPERHAP2_LOCUS37061, partial [Linum perenne]
MGSRHELASLNKLLLVLLPCFASGHHFFPLNP